MAKRIETVYLVQDHTRTPDDAYWDGSYWIKVYTSPQRARAAADHYWGLNNAGSLLRWQNTTASLDAYADSGGREKLRYTIVPLHVHPDDRPEP